MRRGEIWWVVLGPGTGGEIRKTRPAVIVSNDAANRHANRVQVMPATSSIARVYPCEALVKIGGGTSKAMADQILTVAKERLIKFEGAATPDEMIEIDRALRTQLGL